MSSSVGSPSTLVLDPQSAALELARLAHSLTSRSFLPPLLEQLQQLLHCDHVSLFLPHEGAAPRFTHAGPLQASIRWQQDGAEATHEAHRPQLTSPLIASSDAPLPFAEDEALHRLGLRTRCYFPLSNLNPDQGILGLAWRSHIDFGPDVFPRWDPLLAILTLILNHQSDRARIEELTSRISQETRYLREETRGERDLRPLTGDSPAMRAVRQAIQQVAVTGSTVLITGETGTGKELVARAIHQLSPRRERLLVTVNCAALAQSVIASELFGHEAGAFTGAVRRRIGRFELAHRGTLFLDEVGELPLETQVLLLRVLQERVIERVGGNEPIPVDVQVIAATHRNLDEAVASGRLRMDLSYRLNVFPIHVPPLRERRADLPSLVAHFIQRFNRRMMKNISHVDPKSMGFLQEYDWPGNVRELENLVERAMIVAPGESLVFDRSWFRSPIRGERSAMPTTFAEAERAAIENALTECGGRIYGSQGAAARLGLKPTTLYGKMKRLGIARPDDET